MINKLKTFLVCFFFNWPVMMILVVVLMIGGIKFGKYISYKFYYQSYVQEETEPLKKRIERLEQLLTNGPVRLQ